MEYIFWLSVVAIFYVYLGYPLILKIIGGDRQPAGKTVFLPRVTLFIPAYNESKIIKRKIENSLALNYPEGMLEVVVASDNSSDDTNRIVAGFKKNGVKFFESAKRGGKNSLINKFIHKCSGEIIVFTDANAFFKEDAIEKLVRNFSDESVGCVVGNLRYYDELETVGKGEGLYFRYESMIKELESRRGTVVAATGSIYAIRKSLFVTLDPDVANDFAHPIQIASRGFKIVYEKEALALEKATSSTAEEFRRRARIVTRGITAFMRYWRDYSMLKGMWGFCFISHKLVRWFIPFFLITLFTANMFLHSNFYRFTLLCQLSFYPFAISGILFKKHLGSLKIFVVPSYFLLINSAAFFGIMKYFVGHRQSIWEAAGTTR